MAFIDHVLQEPSYGGSDKDGNLIVPTSKQVLKEAFSRINIFKTKKNWITLLGWFIILCMSPFLYLFITQYFTCWLLVIMIVYAMIIMGTNGTIWFHRYGTHRSYQFSHPFWRILTQNLVIKTIPEEVYIISHHVHHAK